MHIKIKGLSSLALAVGVCLAHAGNVSAATLSWQETGSGTTGQGVGTTYSELPVTDTFGSILSASKGPITGAPAGFNFYDDFNFTVASSTIDAVTSTIDLNSLLEIDNLQMRLYNASGNPVGPVLNDSPQGLLNGDLGPGGWSTGVNFVVGGQQGTFTALPTTMLDAGTYVLQVRGDVMGTAGGSYSGTLNLQPVPLPAALPLMLSGLGLLGGMVRRRFAR
jgi:hypothetical protein